MMDARAVLVLIGFGSLLVELLRFPVPSEASVYQLLVESDDTSDNDTRVAQARLRSPGRKLVAYLLPTAIGVALFLVPLVAAFWRPLIDYLGPLHRLDTVWSLWLGAVLVVSGRAVTFAASVQLHQHKIRSQLRYSGVFRWCVIRVLSVCTPSISDSVSCSRVSSCSSVWLPTCGTCMLVC